MSNKSSTVYWSTLPVSFSSAPHPRVFRRVVYGKIGGKLIGAASPVLEPIRAAFPGWSGPCVSVLQVDYFWTWRGPQTAGVALWRLDTGDVQRIPAAVLSGTGAEPGRALLIASSNRSEMSLIDIVIPIGVDAWAVAVAADALLEGQSDAASAVVATCGVYAPIAMAFALADAEQRR